MPARRREICVLAHDHEGLEGLPHGDKPALFPASMDLPHVVCRASGRPWCVSETIGAKIY